MFLLDEYEEQMTIIEYLYNNRLINDKQYGRGCFIENAFRKRKFTKLGIDYKEKVQGGKIGDDEEMINIMQANKDWGKLYQIYTIQELKILEIYVGLEHKMKQLILSLSENYLYELLELIAKLLAKSRTN